MEKERLCKMDLHTHTKESRCASRLAELSGYLPFCESEGIEAIGIADHLYDGRGLEAMCRTKQDAERFCGCGVEIYIGCEAELFYTREPYLTREMAKELDYVLLSPSHIYNLIGAYTDFDLSTPESAKIILLENFKNACLLDFGVPTGIAHPLYPISAPFKQQIIDGYTEDELCECYTLAAKTGKSIEIHACVYRKGVYLDEEGLSPRYIEMLSIAKKCGCKFHFGSDAHSAESFCNKHALLERAAQRAGITKDDLWSF